MNFDTLLDLHMEGKVSIQDFLQAKIHETFTVAADRLAQSGDLSRDERIELSGVIGDVLKQFNDDFPEAVGSKEIEVDLTFDEIIRKKGSQFCLFSKKKNPKTGERRNLGCFPSKKKAREREGQIQFFKRQSLDHAIDAMVEGFVTPQDIIAGAVFDFAGFLTTRDESIPIGAKDNAAPVADLTQDWLDMRGLGEADAAVKDWAALIAQPAPFGG